MIWLLVIILLGACESDGDDGSDMGNWVTIQSPPGHPEQECWAWVHASGLQTGYGGPECFDNKPVSSVSKHHTAQEVQMFLDKPENQELLNTPEGRDELAKKLLGPQ